MMRWWHSEQKRLRRRQPGAGRQVRRNDPTGEKRLLRRRRRMLLTECLWRDIRMITRMLVAMVDDQLAQIGHRFNRLPRHSTLQLAVRYSLQFATERVKLWEKHYIICMLIVILGWYFLCLRRCRRRFVCNCRTDCDDRWWRRESS
jgi:hypothetical protein